VKMSVGLKLFQTFCNDKQAGFLGSSKVNYPVDMTTYFENIKNP